MRQLEYAKKIHEKLLAAKKLFLKCKIAEALPLLEETAGAGESEARYMLATIYSKGLACEKNPEYAALLTDGTIAEENPDELKKRADDGDVFAQYEMAQYHLRAAWDYLKQSADQNYFLALQELDYVKLEEVKQKTAGAEQREKNYLAKIEGYKTCLANIFRIVDSCINLTNDATSFMFEETDDQFEEITDQLEEITDQRKILQDLDSKWNV